MKITTRKTSTTLASIILISMPVFSPASIKTVSAPAGKNIQATNEPIRGIWLTNVASKALDSRKNIQEAVALCTASGINNIYVVTWNGGHTLYPSKVMQKTFSRLIDPRFAGRDPLRELIEEAHKKNIKVHAWFEFGFAASHKQNGGEIIKRKPHWAAIDNQGKLVTKNNFEWMNAFHPEVQDFMLSLLQEVVTNYDIDGIQGDDRLPANPSTAGYDKYTVSIYKKEHKNLPPPVNYKDAAWVNWRAGKLNDFMKRLHDEIKATKPNIIISMAPSIFPWSKEEYLQDWPTWVKNKWVDYIFPQVYRYDIQAYTTTLDANLKFMTGADKNIFYPGLLLKVDKYTPSQQFLDQMVEANRQRGIQGEVFFFYEGIKLHPGFFTKYALPRSGDK
jgi:uncharacterized lipoprotein YddW (UPF0748 family)